MQDFNIIDILKSGNTEGGDNNITLNLIQNLEKKLDVKTKYAEEKISKIEEDLYKLTKDFQNLKNAHDLTNRNIDHLKDKTNNFENKLNELNNYIKNLENELNKKIEDENNKLQEDFNNKIEELRNLINSNDSLPVPAENEKDSNKNDNAVSSFFSENKFKEINRKILELDKQIKLIPTHLGIDQIKSDISQLKAGLLTKSNISDYQELKELLYELQKNLTSLKDQFEDFNSNQTDHDDIQKIKSKLEQLNNKVHELYNTSIENNQNSHYKNNNIDMSKYLEIGTFNDFKTQVIKEFNNVNVNFTELRKLIDEILNALKTKTTYKDLKALEDDFLTKLEELRLACSKKFADKLETSKNIKYLDSQIKNIINVYIKKMEKGDNWLLAKKPLGNLCASCESYIGELKDNSNYVPWNKYPARDPNDKLYRMGNGYSKMLQMIQIDDNGKEIDNSFSRTVGNNNINGSINNSSILPKITNQSGMNLNTAMDEEETIGNVVGHSDEQNTQPKIMKIIKKNKNQN
jgi:chromosome segregation ATPase